MKSVFQIVLILLFLGSCMNDDRCTRDCDKNFSVCLLVATNENSLGIGFICKVICDNCKSGCYTVTSSSGGRSSSTSRGGSGGGGGGGSSGGGGGGGGHGGGGHGGSGIIF